VMCSLQWLSLMTTTVYSRREQNKYCKSAVN
jgi:hypothetical protein